MSVSFCPLVPLHAGDKGRQMSPFVSVCPPTVAEQGAAMSEPAAWTTRVDPAYSRRFGVEEMHNAFFEPPAWTGRGPMITLLIPECELHVTLPGRLGEPGL